MESKVLKVAEAGAVESKAESAAPEPKAQVKKEESHFRPQQAARPNGDQTIAKLVTQSGNPEAAKLRDEIEALKKERIESIIRVKIARKRLGYKQNEKEEVRKLMEQNKTDTTEQRRQIGKMKRIKNSLEFRVSTEARSLAEERELIKKISETNAKLKELYKSLRFEKKMEFVEGDIKRYTEEVETSTKKITEIELNLDERYDALRKLLGIERGKRREQGENGERREHHDYHEGHDRREPHERRPHKEQQQEAINFEDIAVIKKKKSS